MRLPLLESVINNIDNKIKEHDEFSELFRSCIRDPVKRDLLKKARDDEKEDLQRWYNIYTTMWEAYQELYDTSE